MANWYEDPELFLHKGHREDSVVHLWRCKKATWPMRPEDFIDEGPVTDYLSLVGDMPWSRSYYDALVDFISQNQFLVNGQGMVIVELYKLGPDEKIADNQRIYLRSIDIISMETYGLDTKVPFRAAEYLEDGRAAPVWFSPNGQNLNEDLKQEKNDLEANLITLKNNEKNLDAYLSARTAEVATLRIYLEDEKNDKHSLENKNADLEAIIVSLKDNEVKLTGDLIASQNSWINKIAALQLDAERERTVKDVLEKRIADLVVKILVLKSEEKNLSADLTKRSREVATLRQELKREKSNRKTQERKVSQLEAKLIVLKDNEKLLLLQANILQVNRRSRSMKVQEEICNCKYRNWRPTSWFRACK